MSLKLLIDEDSQAKPLVKMLRKAGHNVVTVNEAGLAGEPVELLNDNHRLVYRLTIVFLTNDSRVLLFSKIFTPFGTEKLVSLRLVPTQIG